MVMDPGSFMHGDVEELLSVPQDQALLDLGRKWLRQISVRKQLVAECVDCALH